MIRAIIGANYGDEGKGLAVNYFSGIEQQDKTTLVVRHNGGAQSGHTVETNGKRFVFHELSSGSFNGADTYWDRTYHPDLYALGKEYDAFYELTGNAPIIYCHKEACITTIDDILLNCYKETFDKAGSCGMGVWECIQRGHAGYSITALEAKIYDTMELFNRLKEIRDKYSIPKLFNFAGRYLNKDSDYKDMLLSDTTLFNYAVGVKKNAKLIQLTDSLGEIIDDYDNVIFENGQGLLIDGDYDISHGTPSKTGLYNIRQCLSECGKTLDEVIYVTRTYLTRHGLGDFVEEAPIGYYDDTNIFNEWQGHMRYGKFDTVDDLVRRVKRDCPEIEPHILVTHTNITKGKILTQDGGVDIDSLPFEKIYISDNRHGVSDTVTKHS